MSLIRKYILLLSGCVSVSFSLSAQQTTIHPLFGLTYQNDSTHIKLVAIDQINGNWEVLDSITGADLFGASFANDPDFHTLSFYTSSLYIQYQLPQIYAPFSSGLTHDDPAPAVSAIEYFPQSPDTIYGIAGNSVVTASDSSGEILTTLAAVPLTINENKLSGTRNIASNLYYFISSLNGSNLHSFLYTYNIVQDSLFDDILVSGYSTHRLVYHETNDKLYSISSDSLNRHALIEIDAISGDVDVIADLPSCQDCSDTIIHYDKEAIIIDEERNWLIATRQEVVMGISEYYLITVDITTGEIIHDIILPGPLSNLYFSKVTEDLVFPGDANHDKEVNMLDVLFLGLAYNETTQLRSPATPNWVGQPGQGTVDSVFGVDIKHMDCNGDGQVNVLDTVSIQKNYRAIHNSEAVSIYIPTGQSNCSYPLSLSHPEYMYEGDTVFLHIRLNTSEPIYGISFTMEYDPRFIQENSVQLDFSQNAWFGTLNQDYIVLKKDFYDEGRLDVGLVGIDHQNRSGNGDNIITIIWTMEEDIIPIALGWYNDVPMRITNVVAIANDESTLDICGVDTTMRVVIDDPTNTRSIGVDPEIVLYPNPITSNLFYLDLRKVKKQDVFIEIIGIDGKLYLQKDVPYHPTLQMSHQLMPGVYFIRLHLSDTIVTKKILILHE